MKTTLYAYWRTSKYIEGLQFFTREMSGVDELIHLGEIEIDNPFSEPDLATINQAKVESINAEIQEHKAKINVLENQAKDLLCIELSA